MVQLSSLSNQSATDALPVQEDPPHLAQELASTRPGESWIAGTFCQKEPLTGNGSDLRTLLERPWGKGSHHRGGHEYNI